MERPSAPLPPRYWPGVVRKPRPRADGKPLRGRRPSPATIKKRAADAKPRAVARVKAATTTTAVSRDASDDASDDDDDDDDDAVDDDASIKGGFKFNSQSKRTQSLRDWLVAHFDSPYPEERDKERMAAASGMTRAQVGNWFINARVRIWRPLVMQLGEEVRLLPIRPRSRGERRSLRTFPVVTLHPRFPFNA
jgi:hypothetical protein